MSDLLDQRIALGPPRPSQHLYPAAPAPHLSLVHDPRPAAAASLDARQLTQQLVIRAGAADQNSRKSLLAVHFREVHLLVLDQNLLHLIQKRRNFPNAAHRRLMLLHLQFQQLHGPSDHLSQRRPSDFHDVP